MSRESKAAAIARKNREMEEEASWRERDYPSRLMLILERALRVNYDIDVVDQKFYLVDRDERNDTYTFSNVYSGENSEVLDSLACEIIRKEKKEAERNRLATVRWNAINKLTEEERQVLGIN